MDAQTVTAREVLPESSAKETRGDSVFDRFKTPAAVAPAAQLAQLAQPEQDLPVDVGPTVPDPDIAAAMASEPKHLLGTAGAAVKASVTSTVATAAPLSTPRGPPPRLRYHPPEDDDTLRGPMDLRDGPPPPGSVVVAYGRGIKQITEAPRHRPATYASTATTASEAVPASGLVTEMRIAQARPEAPPLPKGSKRDPSTAAIHDALAHLGPPETVVDVIVEVFDETMNQFWTIGGAASQPLSIIREPHRYLKYGGYYRISVCGAGEGFDTRKTTSFTSKSIGPPRHPSWRFDESDIAVNVFGERGDFPMGFPMQPMMPQPPPLDPAETVVRSVRALKEVEKVLRPDKDDEDKRHTDELEAELRMARMRGGDAWGGGGGPMYYRQQQDDKRREDEDRRRREDEDRRRVDEDRRRTEDEKHRHDEEERRRREEDERRRSDEEKRRAEDERRRELAEIRAQTEKQIAEIQRQREDDKRRWEEERNARQEAEKQAHDSAQTVQTQREREEERRRYEDTRREERERWETERRQEKEHLEQTRRNEEVRRTEERRRSEEAIAEIRRQNEMLVQRMDRPQESPFDKLFGNLPQLMLQWKDMNSTGRGEQLEAARLAREESRYERERTREDATRQMQMWQEMSKMNVESLRVQSEQSQQYSRSLLEVLGKSGSADILNSVAGAMNMAVQAQTSALTAIAKSGLASGQASPWVDVAAGAIEAAGGIATSFIAAKMGVSPEAIKQMMLGGEEGAPQGPRIRRPPPIAGLPMPQLRQPSPPVAGLPAPQPRRLQPVPPQPVQHPPQQAAPLVRQPQPVLPQPKPKQPVRVTIPRPVPPQVPPQVQDTPSVPGLPQKIVQRVLASGKAGEPPEIVARKLFSLVELCDVNELHKGNVEAERIMDGLTTEAKVPAMLREMFGMVGVTDEAYLEAIREVYIRLIYAYVEALQGGKKEGIEEDREEEGIEEAETEEGIAEEEVEVAPEAMVLETAEPAAALVSSAGPVLVKAPPPESRVATPELLAAKPVRKRRIAPQVQVPQEVPVQQPPQVPEVS